MSPFTLLFDKRQFWDVILRAIAVPIVAKLRGRFVGWDNAQNRTARLYGALFKTCHGLPSSAAK